MTEWMRGTTGKQRGVVLPIVAVITLLALSSITHVAYAVSNITKLTSPKPELFGHFGQSVAITENDPLVVVGAPQESADTTTEASGHAYVFDATTGTPINTLATPSSQLSGNFGYSVAISGTTVVVGAPGESADTTTLRAGKAYIFDAITGSRIHTLNSPSPQLNGIFGSSVAISGATVVVGAPQESADTNRAGAGHVYVFDATTGDLLHTLTSPNSEHNGNFGFSVAISGDTIVVGASFESVDTTMGHEGRAYVFDATTGDVVHTLTSPTPQPDGEFGRSVAVSGTTAVVGAPHEDAGTTIQGAGNAYVFDTTTGGCVNILTSPNLQEIGAFGTSVAISGITVVVGAPGEKADTTQAAGNVYVFDATTGGSLNTFTSPKPTPGGGFGWSVGVFVDDVTVVVGAPFETADTTTIRAGNTYVF